MALDAGILHTSIALLSTQNEDFVHMYRAAQAATFFLTPAEEMEIGRKEIRNNISLQLPVLLAVKPHAQSNN